MEQLNLNLLINPQCFIVVIARFAESRAAWVTIWLCRIKKPSDNILFFLRCYLTMHDPKSLQTSALSCRYYCSVCSLVSGLLTKPAKSGGDNG